MPIYLQHGNLIDYVPPTDTSTEDVVFMGGLVGIPQTFIPAGELGALSVDGVYMFTKKDGVSVNLGDVVKYCGTTKLAQDSNADLTLGVAVADAEADSLGVKVKINSVLPTDGGGGGCGTTIAVDTALSTSSTNPVQNKVVTTAINGKQATLVSGTTIKTINGNSVLGSGNITISSGGDITLNPFGGLKNEGCGLGINVGDGVEILRCTGALTLKVCTASGLSIQNGMLVASGGGGGDGLQNLATGDGSLSILGEATTSQYSTSVGRNANACGCGSSAIGAFAKAYKDYSTAFGAYAYIDEVGTTVLSAFDDSGSAKTQLYLIGAGSTMSTTYSDGEAGLGFMYKDSSGNIVKRGTIKLSALMTENTDSFAPSGW